MPARQSPLPMQSGVAFDVETVRVHHGVRGVADLDDGVAAAVVDDLGEDQNRARALGGRFSRRAAAPRPATSSRAPAAHHAIDAMRLTRIALRAISAPPGCRRKHRLPHHSVGNCRTSCSAEGPRYREIAPKVSRKKPAGFALTRMASLAAGIVPVRSNRREPMPVTGFVATHDFGVCGLQRAGHRARGCRRRCGGRRARGSG